MSTDPRKLKLLDVLQADAAEIAAARQKAMLVHQSGDIDAAGDEVEMAVRQVLRRKLPSAYYVGHGHVLDARWHVSKQLDVVIADNHGSPILFRSENDTEYFPFESVYVVGEVKSAYYKDKRYIDEFVEKVALLKHDLSRAQVPPTYIASNIELGPGMASGISVPYRNPLFTFMLFVHGGDFALEHVREIYSSKPASELPNLLCFLNKGIVMNVRFAVPALGAQLTWPSLDILPEFNQPTAGEMDRWAFVPLGTSDYPLAANFAVMYFSLVTHLNSCVLQRPDLFAYLKPVISASCSGKIEVLGL